jgi:hypothetical protein
MSGSEDALASFGARPSLLSAAQRSELDARGYLLIPDAIDHETVVALRRRFDEIVASDQNPATPCGS